MAPGWISEAIKASTSRQRLLHIATIRLALTCRSRYQGLLSGAVGGGHPRLVRRRRRAERQHHHLRAR
jgi:hypothetical protein